MNCDDHHQTGGSIVSYGIQGGPFPALSPEFLFRGLSLHGFWLVNWIRNAPRTEIQEIYQKLGDLVADGSLSAAVDHCIGSTSSRKRSSNL